jgi:hypothetical protein
MLHLKLFTRFIYASNKLPVTSGCCIVLELSEVTVLHQNKQRAAGDAAVFVLFYVQSVNVIVH